MHAKILSIMFALVLNAVFFTTQAFSEQEIPLCSSEYSEEGTNYYGGSFCEEILTNIPVEFDYDQGDCEYNIQLISFYTGRNVESFFYSEAQTCTNLSRVFSYFRVITLISEKFSNADYVECLKAGNYDVFFNGESAFILDSDIDPTFLVVCKF